MKWTITKSYNVARDIVFSYPTMLKFGPTVLKSAILAVFLGKSGISRKKPDILSVGPSRQAWHFVSRTWHFGSRTCLTAYRNIVGWGIGVRLICIIINIMLNTKGRVYMCNGFKASKRRLQPFKRFISVLFTLKIHPLGGAGPSSQWRILHTVYFWGQLLQICIYR